MVALLDEAKKLGVLGTVSDEGDFWETRSLDRLTKEIGEQSAMLASVLGVLKDAVGQAPGGAGTVEAPIAGYPNFEHLEAEGQRLLPEQLKDDAEGAGAIQPAPRRRSLGSVWRFAGPGCCRTRAGQTR